MRNLIARLIPIRIKKILKYIRDQDILDYAHASFAQEGEDMVLRRIFGGQSNGFYVDVGAYHPYQYSNTYYFYRRGWRGINIEPNPEAKSQFVKARPNDINIQLGVAEQAGTLKYYCYDVPALNTCSLEMVRERMDGAPSKVRIESEVEVQRLESILAKYLPHGTQIDFMSVDVEGLDFAVLNSNDWNNYRPKCLLVEVINANLEEVMAGEIYKFMRNNNYSLFAKTHNTLIFLENE
jgi:FkbM family methyltransferase